MSESVSGKIPVWFWVIAIGAILWSLMGVASYLGDAMMSEETLAAMPEAQRGLYEAQPAWLTGVYAIAVFASLAGALALAFRRSLATPLFAASLAAIIVQFGYVFGAMNAFAVVGAAGVILPAAVFIIAVFLVWFSREAKAKGFLR